MTVIVFDVADDPTVAYRKAASLDAIVADPEVDAVIVCLPNHLNKQTTIAALGHGSTVFCEKPPCFTGQDMREIIAAEAASGRVLMYGFNHRHHEAIIKMKKLIDAGWMAGSCGCAAATARASMPPISKAGGPTGRRRAAAY